MLFSILFAVAQAEELQTPSLNAQTLHLSNAGRWVRLRDPLPSLEGELAWKWTLSHSSSALEFQSSAGEYTALVGPVSQLDLASSYRFDRFRVGVSLPVQLSGGSDVSTGAVGLGSTGLDGQVYLVEGNTNLAVGGRLSLPSVGQSAEALKAPLTATLDAVASQSVGSGWHVVGLVGVNHQPAVELDSAEWGARLRLGAGAAREVDGKTQVQLELTSEPQFGSLGQSITEVLLASEVKIGALSSYVLMPALVVGLTDGPGTPQYRVVLQGRRELYQSPDVDGDGLVGDQDSCPAVAEDIDGFEDTDGCPEATSLTILARDTDGFEISDGTVVLGEEEGAIGGTFEVTGGTVSFSVNGVEFSEEIPEGPPLSFTAVLPAPKGRLMVHAVDAEGNAIEGAVWSATGEISIGDQPAGEVFAVRPGSYELMAQAPGYRLTKSVVEVQLDTEATLTLTMEPSRAEISAERIDIKDSVYFETAKAVIKEESHDLLDEISELLIAHPELTLIRIEGHTDSRGSADANRVLSQQRADAVKLYLSQKGVAIERLNAVGFGEDRPLDRRNTRAAWEKNRRVDFFVESRSDSAE